MDTDLAGKYQDMKSFMVTPGIYFLDAQGKLIELLQGEVNTQQVAKLIN